MIRIVAENLLLFLLPTLAYVAYVLLTRQPAGSPGQDGTHPQAGVLDNAPIFYLLAAGAFLVLGTLAFFATNSGGRPDQAYKPPVYKDGHIEPGRIE